jgi:4-amino-4-deoxy-L-arabinose transferase-like glycosyltransferase
MNRSKSQRVSDRRGAGKGGSGGAEGEGPLSQTFISGYYASLVRFAQKPLRFYSILDCDHWSTRRNPRRQLSATSYVCQQTCQTQDAIMPVTPTLASREGLRETSFRWGMALLAAGAVVYVCAALYQLVLPGLNHDEALDAVAGMQVVLGQRLDAAGVANIGGHQWPIMVMPYVGAISSYLVMPALAAFGVSVLTLRASMVALGLVTLLAAWLLLRELLDERAAGLAVLLLAVSPSFVFWTRMGSYISLPMIPLWCVAVWGLARWQRRRKSRYLVLAGLCLGLGLSTKALFVWIPISLVVAWLILSPAVGQGPGWRRWLWPFSVTPPFSYAAAVIAFAVGAAPFLLYNLLTKGGTWHALTANLGQTQLYGVRNLALLENLVTVLRVDLPGFLNGGWFASTLGGPELNPVAGPALLVSAAVLLILAFMRRLPYRWRPLALLATLFVSMLALSAFTISSLGANHLSITWPIPQAIVATAAISLGDLVSTMVARGPAIRKGLAVALALAVTLVVGAEAWTTLRYHRTLAATGGVGQHSDAIYGLAADLQTAGNTPVVALDWGFRRNLQILTQGRINPEERYTFGPEPDQAYIDYINTRVGQGPAIYLFHAPGNTAFGGHWDLFEDAAYRHGLAPVLWRHYEQRTGKPNIEAYTVAPLPRLFDAPPVQKPIGAQLGDAIELLGVNLPAGPFNRGKNVRLQMVWRALDRLGRNYKVFVHVIGDDGRVVAQQDSEPVVGSRPTTGWQSGEVTVDPVRIALKGDTPAGRYRLFTGMYDEATGERLPLVLDGERLAGDTLQIGTIEVTP